MVDRRAHKYFRFLYIDLADLWCRLATRSRRPAPLRKSAKETVRMKVTPGPETLRNLGNRG